jgi:hypothetical protein
MVVLCCERARKRKEKKTIGDKGEGVGKDGKKEGKKGNSTKGVYGNGLKKNIKKRREEKKKRKRDGKERKRDNAMMDRNTQNGQMHTEIMSTSLWALLSSFFFFSMN